MEKQDVSSWVGNQLVLKHGQLKAKEVLLALLLVDDSGSIEGSGNTKAVIDGYNGFLEALQGSPGEVRIKTMFLNNRVDVPFQSPREVQPLSCETYRPNHGTPLYLRSVEALQALLNEARQLAERGITVRTMTFIFTDGGDNQSGDTAASDVKTIVDVMLTTGTHIVGGCAVNDGCTNFWHVFAAMGIPEHWVKVLKNDPQDIRNTFRDVGESASFASRDGDSFIQTSQTGFGNHRK